MKDRQHFGNLENQYPSTFIGSCSDAFSFANAEQPLSILPKNAANKETTLSSSCALLNSCAEVAVTKFARMLLNIFHNTEEKYLKFSSQNTFTDSSANSYLKM